MSDGEMLAAGTSCTDRCVGSGESNAGAVPYCTVPGSEAGGPP